MSEKVPRVLAGGGGGGSPGALDVNVRYRFYFWPGSLTWRKARQC